MKPRITINKMGELELWLNESGRDALVRELTSLRPEWEHFHLSAAGPGEVDLSDRAYRPDDGILNHAKVMLRRDEWDAQEFPHVLAGSEGLMATPPRPGSLYVAPSADQIDRL